MSIILLPIILILFAVMMIFSAVGSVGSAWVDVSSGGTVNYDEVAMQDYADQQYAQQFGASTAYEDNILIVFLVDEDYYQYQYIAWVGDHVVTDINMMFGNNQTELGRAFASSVAETFKYSLDSNLAMVVENMENQIVEKQLDSSYKCNENHNQVASKLVNKTNLPLTEATVNDALVSFTESTGIPLVIVVEDSQDVFGKQINGGSIFTLLLAVILIVVAVILVVKAVKRSKNHRGNTQNQSAEQHEQDFYNADDF